MALVTACAISNTSDLNERKYLLGSSTRKGFEVKMFGLGEKFEFIHKVTMTCDYLKSIPEENPIICFTDAYDVFYLDNLHTIRKKFLSFDTDIVFSVEALYSHQIPSDQPFYDKINEGKGPYKYLNTGSIIGYKKSLIKFLEDVKISISNEKFISEIYKISWNDQTIISSHLVQNWGRYNIKFDTECKLFYVTAGDWDDIDKYVDKDLTVIRTGNRPSAIHVPWKRKYEALLAKLYYLAFKKHDIIENNSYTWGDTIMSFMETNKVYFAGDHGDYKKRDSYTYDVTVWGVDHVMIFDKDYKNYTAIRKEDLGIMKGSLVPYKSYG